MSVFQDTFDTAVGPADELFAQASRGETDPSEYADAYTSGISNSLTSAGQTADDVVSTASEVDPADVVSTAETASSLLTNPLVWVAGLAVVGVVGIKLLTGVVSKNPAAQAAKAAL